MPRPLKTADVSSGGEESYQFFLPLGRSYLAAVSHHLTLYPGMTNDIFESDPELILHIERQRSRATIRDQQSFESVFDIIKRLYPELIPPSDLTDREAEAALIIAETG